MFGCVVVFAAFLVERLSPGKPDHRVLAIGAAVAATTVPAAVVIESPTDTEAALSRSALVLGWMLTAVALGCALSAAAEAGIRHGRLAVGVAITATCGVILVRAVSIEDRILALFALPRFERRSACLSGAGASERLVHQCGLGPGQAGR